jgi:hypothetical protein
LQVRQPTIPKRTRSADFGFSGIDARDLPVPARQGQLKKRLAQRLRKFFAAFFRRSDIGHQSAQVNAKAAVESALDRLPIERRQNNAGDKKDDNRPGGG